MIILKFALELEWAEPDLAFAKTTFQLFMSMDILCIRALQTWIVRSKESVYHVLEAFISSRSPNIPPLPLKTADERPSSDHEDRLKFQSSELWSDHSSGWRVNRN